MLFVSLLAIILVQVGVSLWTTYALLGVGVVDSRTPWKAEPRATLGVAGCSANIGDRKYRGRISQVAKFRCGLGKRQYGVSLGFSTRRGGETVHSETVYSPLTRGCSSC